MVVALPGATGGELNRAGFKCVEALGRIIIRGAPYPPSNAIINMHLQL